MNRILAAFSFLIITLPSFAQNIPLYNWRSHIPYLTGMQVCEAGNRIYCATQTGLFFFDKSDNRVHPLSKVDGYSDIFVKTMAYAPKHDMLFIAYQNGNLDVVHAGKITNHPDIENQANINSIYIDPTESTAYFALSSTDINIGIFEWPMDNPEFHLSYNPNTLPNINKVTILGDSLYECSASGIKKVNLNVPLKRDPSQWETISTDSCGSIVSFDGRIVASFQNGLLKCYNGITNTWTTIRDDPHHHRINSLESVNGQLVMGTTDGVSHYKNISFGNDSFALNQVNDAIVDEQGLTWIAQGTYALMTYRQGNFGYYQPPGFPSTTLGYHSYGYHNQVWVSAGLTQSNGAPAYDNHGFYMYDGETWHNYNQQTDYGKNPSGNGNGPDIRDFMGMAVDSVTGHLWIGCLDSGVMEFNSATNTIINIWNAGNTNKGLLPSPASQFSNQNYVPISDVKFDQNDNLWMANYNNSSNAVHQLSEKRGKGGWATYNSGSMTHVNSLVVDNSNGVWLIDSRDPSGLVIFNSATRKTTTLGTTAGQGGLPSAYINCGVSDKNGEVWLGTTAGPCVYSDPGLLFGSNNYDVQRPYISTGSNAGYLLGSLPVTSIAVDGADRKWFGTNQGVWLTSPEGDKILSHFDMTNSPLVSNQINTIAINGVTGEVFFVTDKGIVSYRDAATDGGAKNEVVYAFPNPVKPGYRGPITIAGLVSDANVKITDVTGTLVYETTALGGEATWNGKNFSGREANSGVYLVFITNSDGSQTAMTKILIVR